MAKVLQIPHGHAVRSDSLSGFLKMEGKDRVRNLVDAAKKAVTGENGKIKDAEGYEIRSKRVTAHQ